MQVVETKSDGLARAYALTLPAGHFAEKMNEKLLAARADLQMKGFRKGKAPLPLLKKLFGKSIMGEVLQESVDGAVRSHFEATGDRPAMQPDVRIANEQFDEGQDLTVEISYEKLPEVPEADFAAIAVERPVAEVEDGAVDEALARKAAVFACTVKEVRAPKAAGIDDALAQRYGVETLDELKVQLRERLAQEYAFAARALVKRRLLDALDAAVMFELPPTLVNAEANQIAHQLWHEENPEVKGHDHPEITPTDEHRKLAERRVRLGLLLAETGNRNQIAVTDEELSRAIVMRARQMGVPEKAFSDYARQNEGALQQLRAPIFEDKVVDYILDLAQVADVTVTKDELQAMLESIDADGWRSPA